MSVSGFLAGEGRGDDRLVAGSTNRLRDPFDEQGQSPWLDNLTRSYVQDGSLARFAEAGVRG